MEGGVAGASLHLEVVVFLIYCEELVNLILCVGAVFVGAVLNFFLVRDTLAISYISIM